MQISTELKKIKNEIGSLKNEIGILSKKRAKTSEEIEKAIEELKIQEINFLIFEQSLYEDESKVHFLDILGLSPREYVELENELIEKKLKKGANLEAEIEKSELDRDKYYLEIVKEELRKRKKYHPNKSRAKTRKRLQELLSLEVII